MNDERNAPATRGDLQNLEAKFQLNLRDLEDRLVEAIRDSQTEVLKAFYGFSQSIQERFRAQDDMEMPLKKRMTVIETRMLEVEKRLNMPPAAA
ncbi:MAG: hypothetical protein ACRD3N_01345 [Terracidiphilus sp.]